MFVYKLCYVANPSISGELIVSPLILGCVGSFTTQKSESLTLQVPLASAVIAVCLFCRWLRFVDELLGHEEAGELFLWN